MLDKKGRKLFQEIVNRAAQEAIENATVHNFNVSALAAHPNYFAEAFQRAINDTLNFPKEVMANAARIAEMDK